jgi:hypothetical protein
MGEYNNLKPFDRFIYEDLYFNTIKLVKEDTEIKVQ